MAAPMKNVLFSVKNSLSNSFRANIGSQYPFLRSYCMQSTNKIDQTSGNQNEIPVSSTDEHQYVHPDKILEKAVSITSGDMEFKYLLPPDTPPGGKILRVSIIGTPNTGKSTLTNQLMGWRVSSVSKKVHTTRKNTLAVLTKEDTQIVFMDTPGLIHPEKRRQHNLEKSLVVDPLAAITFADIVAVMVDLSDKWRRHALDKEVLKLLYLNPGARTILILNKIDCLKSKEQLLMIVRTLSEGIVGGQTAFAATRKPVTPKTNLKKLLDRAERKMLKKVQENSTSKATNIEDKVNLFEQKELNINENMSDRVNDKIDNMDDQIEGEDTGRFNAINDADSRVDTNLSLKHRTENMLHTHPVQKVKNFGQIEFNISPNSRADDRSSSSSKGKLDSDDQISDNLDWNSNELVEDIGGDSLEIENKMESELEKMDQEESGCEDMDLQTYQLQAKKVQHLVRNKVGWPHFEEVFMISALSGNGIQELQDYLLSIAKPGDWDYHSCLVTDQDPLEIVRQCIREKLLNYLPMEVPYNVEPNVASWNVDEDGVLNLMVELITRNRRHYFKTLGRHGETISAICLDAKQDLMNTFRCELRMKIVAVLREPRKKK